MIQPYRDRANNAGTVFIVALLSVVALISLGSRNLFLFQIAGLVSYIAAFVWYFNFAKAKGRSGWWVLLGFLHLLGFIIILILPDKTQAS
jgi:hypothetical protein